MTLTTPPDDRLSGPVHGWFGLSYSNYAVIPRALMQSMPEEWQARMVACLREINAAYRHLDHLDGYDVTPGAWETIDDCSQDQLVAAGVRTYWVDGSGETIPEPDEPAAGQEPRYEWRGEEWTGQQRVFIPGETRVPHYDRGRTWVEPRLPEPTPAVAASTYVPAVDDDGNELWRAPNGRPQQVRPGDIDPEDARMEGWRRLHVEQPAEPDLIDGEGDIWVWGGEGYRLKRDPGMPAYTRAEIEEDFGGAREATEMPARAEQAGASS